MRKPRIAITLGDPNGIGPEIAVRTVADEQVLDACRPLLVGSPDVVERAAESLDQKVILYEFDERELEQGGDSSRWEDVLPKSSEHPVVPVMQPSKASFSQVEPGKCTAEAGRLAYESIVTAHETVSRGWAEAMVTCPINKEALHKAGISPIAHTEILGQLCTCMDPLTLFVVKDLWIAFFTRHLSLAEAVRAVRKTPLVAFIRNLANELQSLGMENPTIGVAALNPHGGEEGLLGWEEKEEIIPAIEALEGDDIHIAGPIPADSIFHLGLNGQFDCVVALYHDQGHIAAKSGFFYETTAMTLGLPYLRTSVDHGTGFDIAWQGKAREESLIRATLLAVEVLKHTRKP